MEVKCKPWLKSWPLISVALAQFKVGRACAKAGWPALVLLCEWDFSGSQNIEVGTSKCVPSLSFWPSSPPPSPSTTSPPVPSSVVPHPNRGLRGIRSDCRPTRICTGDYSVKELETLERLTNTASMASTNLLQVCTADRWSEFRN